MTTRPTHCVDCRETLVSQWAWKAASRQQRAEWRAAGKARHIARGLCASDYERRQLAGTLDAYPRGTRRSADVVEDWFELEAQGYSRKHAADRLGMTRKALEKVLERAGVRADRSRVAA